MVLLPTSVVCRRTDALRKLLLQMLRRCLRRYDPLPPSRLRVAVLRCCCVAVLCVPTFCGSVSWCRSLGGACHAGAYCQGAKITDLQAKNVNIFKGKAWSVFVHGGEFHWNNGTLPTSSSCSCTCSCSCSVQTLTLVGSSTIAAAVTAAAEISGDYYALSTRVAEESGMGVLAVDYRTTASIPISPFPAAIEDVIAAMKWLKDQGASKVTLHGDSSGGASCRSFVQIRPTLPSCLH